MVVEPFLAYASYLSGICAGLASSHNDNTKWTILVPNNTTYDESLVNQDLDKMVDLGCCQTTLLIAMVSQHIITDGAYFVDTRAFENHTQLQTFETLFCGDKLAVGMSASGSDVAFFAGGTSANITSSDIKAGKSLVHIIDNVLLPRIAAKEPKKRKAECHLKPQTTPPRRILRSSGH